MSHIHVLTNSPITEDLKLPKPSTRHQSVWKTKSRLASQHQVEKIRWRQRPTIHVMTLLAAKGAIDIRILNILTTCQPLGLRLLVNFGLRPKA
eukprot:4330215-Pyramimonas_sp.AAC.1